MAAGVCTLLAVPFSPHLHIHDIGLLVIPGCALANNLKQKGFSLGVSLLPLLPLLPFMTIFILPAGDMCILNLIIISRVSHFAVALYMQRLETR